MRYRRLFLFATLLWAVMSVPTGPAHAQSGSSTPGATPAREIDADVVIYGSTTSGIGALWALQEASGILGSAPSVVCVSPSGGLESPLANGLSVEDVYGGEAAVNGFALRIREEITDRYLRQDVYPLASGRLTYEPAVAREVLSYFYDRNGVGRPGVTYLNGGILEATDNSLLVADAEGPTQVTARYFIDASAEGDLVQAVGAPFMVGVSRAVYSRDNPPDPPTSANAFVTAPQYYSALLTMVLSNGPAVPIADQFVPFYDPSSYGVDAELSVEVLQDFWRSWSMSQTLPNDKRELNESWSDFPSGQASFDWVMHPEKRPELHRQMVSHAVNRLRWLQEAGYTYVGLAEVPGYPYVREGIRAVGRRIYLGRDVDLRVKEQPVAYGVYARYDRHDDIGGFAAQFQDSQSSAVWVPLGALLLRDYPNHLVSTAVSTDVLAYNSAVRMEWTRANMGGAAGALVALAADKGVDAQRISYDELRPMLDELGWRFGPSRVVNSFSDVLPDSEYFEPVKFLAALGVVNGYPDGSFGLYDSVLRAQLAKMVVLTLGLHDEEMTNADAPTFPDLDPSRGPYPFDYVEEAYLSGLIGGFTDGTFGAWQNLTRIQLVRIIVRAGGEALEMPGEDFQLAFTDVPVVDRETVAIAVHNGLVNGVSEEVFAPYAEATRGHVAKILYNMLAGDFGSSH